MLFRMLRGWWGSAPRYAAVEFRGELRFLEEAVRLRDEGMQIPIDSTFEFEDALKGYQRLNEGRARGKVVVVVKKEWAA